MAYYKAVDDTAKQAASRLSTFDSMIESKKRERRITKYQLKMLKTIFIRQRGWPVGIPVSQKVGRILVNKKFCEWAPPGIPLHRLKTKQKLVSVRCTTLGELYATGVLP